MKIFFIILFAITILLYSLYFIMWKFSLCSPVSGQIYFGKKPLAGVEVVRKSSSAWFDGEDIYIEKTLTDTEGRFSFPERQPKMRFMRFTGWLPHDPATAQNILVSHEGKEYSLFSGIKRTYETNSEVRYYTSVEKERPNNEKYTTLESVNVPIRLECDLEKAGGVQGYDRYPAGSGYEGTSNFHGICTLK